jgi:hypothetical protein
VRGHSDLYSHLDECRQLARFRPIFPEVAATHEAEVGGEALSGS